MNERIKKVIFSIDICQFLGYIDYADPNMHNQEESYENIG